MEQTFGIYVLKRLGLVFPTLLGILFINFLLVQWIPGGPVEQMVAEIQGLATDSTARLSGATGDMAILSGEETSLYRGSQGLDPKVVENIKKMYGFDQPLWKRFLTMLKKYLTADLGESYFKHKKVWQLIKDKLPVSISLGFWSTLFTYLISVSLGILKARAHKSLFDVVTSFLVILGYAIPGFLFGVILMVVFAGGNFYSWFPLRGLSSYGAETWPLWKQLLDYAYHMFLPLLTQVLGGFASLTFLTKNAFLEELHKPYVQTAYAKGLSESQVLWRHVFRNAVLVLVVGFPKAFLHMFFTGALLVEILFSLDGLGYLGFNAAITRDYPVVFGTLYIFTLSSLLLHVLGDWLYVRIDPRLSFKAKAS